MTLVQKRPRLSTFFGQARSERENIFTQILLQIQFNRGGGGGVGTGKKYSRANKKNYFNTAADHHQSSFEFSFNGFILQVFQEGVRV